MIKTENEILEILKQHSPDVLNSVYVEEASENKNEDFSYDEGFVADSFGKPLLMIAAGVFYLTTNIITAPFLGAAMGGEILYNKAKEKIKQHIDNKTAEKARKILNADGKLKSLIDKAKQMHGKELSKEDQELFVNIKRTAHKLIKNDTSLTDDEKSAVFRAIGMGIYNANKKPTTEINESENVTPEQQEAIKNLEDVMIAALIDATDGPGGVAIETSVEKIYQEMMDLAESFLDEVQDAGGDMEYCSDCIDELFKRLGKKLQQADFSHYEAN